MQVASSRFPAVLTAALLIQAFLHHRFIAEHCATFDEPAYLAAGMAYATTGKDAQVFIHPPLAKRIAGFAALVADADPTGAPDDHHGIITLYERNRDTATRILSAARWATALATLTLTVILALAARRLWGDEAGMLAAGLAAVEPNLLANGSLATTDLWPALFMTLFVIRLIPVASGTATGRYRERLGVHAGLALASKFSALGFLPAAALGVWLATGRTEGFRRVLNRLTSAAPRAAGWAALTLIAAYTVHVRVFAPGYGTSGLLSWWPVTLSGEMNYYLPYGLKWAARYAGEGAPAYFHGALREGMVPAYFPTTLLLKVPLAVIALGVIAIVSGGISGPRGAVMLAALAMLGSVLTSRIHIGLRHVLPVVPLLVLTASSSLDAALPRRKLRGLIAIVGLMWAAASTFRASPHFLAHFNELAGGPAGGWRWLSDSSIDWGQDLPALKSWMDTHGVKELPLYYFGRAAPSFHGVGVAKTGPDTPGWKGGLVAISVSYLNGTTTGNLDRFGWARSMTPIATPGWSLHVYDVKEFTSPSRPSSSRTR